MKKLKLAIIGQGRSGRGIHGKFLKSEVNDMFEVTAVVELDAERRQRALEEYPGCRVYEDYRDLFTKEKVDVVVNATYSDEHYAITKDLLMHKFNVLVEKPMARTYYECSDLIKTAKENGVILAVFQQSMMSSFYVEMKKILATGKIGEIKQVSIRYSGLSRRWDWQTLQSKVGGSTYNTGPHPIIMGLDMLDFDKDTKVAFSRIDRVLASGDADDYAKIILTAPGKPVIDIEINSTDAYCDYKFKIQGSKGTYQTAAKSYKMKYIPDGANPERPVIKEFLKNEEGLPAYCSEKLVTCEEEGKIAGELFDTSSKAFYTSLYNTLTTGAPLAVTAEQAAQVISVIETVHAQNPMPVKY